MGLMSDHKSKAIGVAALVIILVANGWVLWSTFGGSSVARGERAFYSVDDGATWFEEKTGQPVPFVYKGKEAVIAQVFDGKNGKFVGYLQRTPAEGAAMLEKVKKKEAPPQALARVALIEIKPPGGKRWLRPQDGSAYAAVMDVKDPATGQQLLEAEPGE